VNVDHLRIIEKKNISIEGDLTARRDMKNDLGEVARALAAIVARSTDILGIVVQGTQQLKPQLLCQSRSSARS
jgi:hypothetical protein